jgi:hypothetical protein
MRICIFSSICLANKNLVDKDFVFIITVLDLSIASNLLIIQLVDWLFKVLWKERKVYKLKKQAIRI